MQLYESAYDLCVDLPESLSYDDLRELLNNKAATQPASNTVRPFPTDYDMDRNRRMTGAVAATLLALIMIAFLASMYVNNKFFDDTGASTTPTLSAEEVKQGAVQTVRSELGYTATGKMITITPNGSLAQYIAQQADAIAGKRASFEVCTTGARHNVNRHGGTSTEEEIQAFCTTTAGIAAPSSTTPSTSAGSTSSTTTTTP
jgi:hypothetical protein